MRSRNADADTVAGFGDEWSRFDFEDQPALVLDQTFADYFSIFPWHRLPSDACGFDAGTGSGRWAERVAPRVGHLHCIDASAEALATARRKLVKFSNVTLHECSLEDMPIDDCSMDFGFSLGVLHHTPDPELALNACARKLKPGAPFLVYLYYSLDNRPLPFRLLWRASDVLRKRISLLPHDARYWVTQAIAASVYWPLARTARLAEKLGFDAENLPLSFYRNKTFYVMRNDSLDRFGTRVEHRFSRREIQFLLERNGFVDIRFREEAPYWCAMGIKA